MCCSISHAGAVRKIRWRVAPKLSQGGASYSYQIATCSEVTLNCVFGFTMQCAFWDLSFTVCSRSHADTLLCSFSVLCVSFLFCFLPQFFSFAFVRLLAFTVFCVLFFRTTLCDCSKSRLSCEVYIPTKDIPVPRRGRTTFQLKQCVGEKE